MNVSVPAMRPLVLLVILVAFGCGDDPSLQIEVEQPANEDYKRLITKTVVTVYESELDTLTCEQIELGDVSEDLLLGAAVAQQTVFKTGRVDGTLDDISRLGKKVVVARMLTDTDVLIAAGCAEQGDLDGDVKLVIETEVAATVAVDTTGIDDPYGKQITIVDPLGESLVGREVRWRLFAPAGGVPASTADVTIDPDESTIWDSAAPGCTDTRGIATMRVTPPSKVSGFAARFRVSWPAVPIDVISGFVRPGFGLQAVADLPASNRCAVRTAGEHRAVCIEGTTTPTPHGRRWEVVQGPLKNWNVVDRGASPALPSRPAGVFSLDEAAGKEVYALLANGNVENLFGTTQLATTTNCGDCTIDDFLVAPACGDDPARIFMHSTTGTSFRVMPARGGTAMELGLPSDLDPMATLDLNTAGCVTTINAQGVEKDVQIVIVDLTTAEGVQTRGLFRCAGGRTCSVTLPFALAGVGFLKAGTATKPEMQMVGTAFDIAGAELIGWVLRPTFDGNTFLLIDRQRFTAAAAPERILVGKLDADAEPDLVWTIPAGRSAIMQVSYAHAIEDGSRLSALAPINSAIEEVSLGDVTGDGFDDLLGVTANSFVVLPQNVDGPTVADRTTESTCGP